MADKKTIPDKILKNSLLLCASIEFTHKPEQINKIAPINTIKPNICSIIKFYKLLIYLFGSVISQPQC